MNEITDFIDSNTMLIPIGIDCSVTQYLIEIKQRNQAFPFDWNVTPISSALRLIQNNFADYMVNSKLLYLPPTDRTLLEDDDLNEKISNARITPVVDTKYKLLFPHDFSVRGEDDLCLVKEKYGRRIHRLMQTLKESKKVLFIYNLREPNYWQIAQYRLAGISFPADTIENLKENFEVIKNIYKRTNIEFVSLRLFKISIQSVDCAQKLRS